MAAIWQLFDVITARSGPQRKHRRTIYRPSVSVIAIILAKLWSGLRAHRACGSIMSALMTKIIKLGRRFTAKGN